MDSLKTLGLSVFKKKMAKSIDDKTEAIFYIRKISIFEDIGFAAAVYEFLSMHDNVTK